MFFTKLVVLVVVAVLPTFIPFAILAGYIGILFYYFA